MVIIITFVFFYCLTCFGSIYFDLMKLLMVFWGSGHGGLLFGDLFCRFLLFNLFYYLTYFEFGFIVEFFYLDLVSSFVYLIFCLFGL